MSLILVVDDQPSNREVLTALLGYCGHRMLEAADGAEGLAIALREPPDLIISDVLMPTMDGYEFVRRLRESPSLAAKPVVFYTAHYLEREALNLAEKCGVSYVIAKPCEPATVLGVVNSALGTSGSTSEIPQAVAVEHLEMITTRLSKTAEDLERANARLEALVEAGLKLAVELDPQKLVDQYSRVARQIVGADICAIGIWDDACDNWSHLAVSGVGDDAAADILARWKPDASEPGWDFRSCPSDLGIPVRTPEYFLGWLCVAGKLGGGSFSEEDEKLAHTLAAQLALGYHNRQLLARARYHEEELEERVRARTRDLEAARQDLESFTLAVSHDLRTPLHHLNGFSSILEERFGKSLEPGASELLRRIQRTSGQMAELVRNLLELSRISKEAIEIETVALDLVLKEALEEVCGLAQDRAIDWKIQPLPPVKGSRVLLKQVFVNLLSNAIKFTGKVNPAMIAVGEAIVGGESRIYVRDNGAGFDPVRADRLFAVFQRLHPQNEYPGNGAGLAIVKRIVDRHGGRIWAESQPGRGATFFFTLSDSDPA